MTVSKTPPAEQPTSSEDDSALFDTPPEKQWRDHPPPHGWDNAADVDQAKTWLTGMRGLVVRNAKGTKHLFDFGMKLRNFGVSHALAVDLVIAIIAPPFEEEIVRKAVTRPYEVASGLPGALSVIRTDEGEEPDTTDDDDWLYGGSVTDQPTWPRPVEYDPKQHGAKNAEKFLLERPAKLISSDGVLYTRDRNVWREISDKELAGEIRATDPKLINDTGKIFSMVAEMHIARPTRARPFDWIDEPNDAPLPNDLILFANGMLDLDSGRLIPHTHRYFATGLPDFNHDPAAACPLWKEKLGEWLAPSFHPTLQEFVGYLLTPDTRIEALLAMIGATRGGKGTISQVMQWLVSREHYTARTLNDLGGSFGLEGCTDKRIIFVPDAHDSKVDNRNVVLDRLKCISGNDDVSVNRKNKTIITTRIPAKIILVANRHPKFLDESGALAARQVLVIFGNSFKGREDRDLRSKLRDELPGIANWALEGLRRLRVNGNRFTIGAEGKAASRELAESQSPALRFAQERLIVTGDLNDHVPLGEAFTAYEDWATYTESLSSRERRNRDDFKHDLMAALMTKGVQYARRRWHDPTRPRWERHGKGEIKRGFFGFRMKPSERVPD